jgi:PPP family 3-phenylpropionic acid transporter
MAGAAARRVRPLPIAAFYGVYFAVLGVVMPFLGPYLQERGISAVGIGLITAAFSLARLLYTPFISMLVDRGRFFRGILGIHVGLAMAAAFAISMAQGPILLGLCFLLIGLGYGTVLPLVEATVLEQIPGPTYGRLRLGGSIGFVIVAMLAGELLAEDGLGSFPVVLGVVLLLLLLACLPFEGVTRPASGDTASQQALGRPVLALLGVLTLHQVAHGPYYAFFSIRIAESGYSHGSVALMWSLGVIAETIAFAGGSWLQHRLGLRRLLHLALLLSPIRWLLLAAPLSLPVLVLSQAGHAVTFAMAHLAAVQLVQRAVPDGTRRLAQSLYSGLSFGFGIVAGSAAAGLCYSRCGGPATFALAGLLSFCVLLLWLPLKPHLKR